MSEAHSLTPSKSTTASLFGAFIATTFIVICHRHGTDFPAGYEGGLAGVLTAIFAWIPKSGRRRKRISRNTAVSP